MHVAKKMIDKQIDSLPVVNDKGEGLEVVGRITKTNITAPSCHLRMTMNYEGDTMKKLTLFIVSDSVGETAELSCESSCQSI